MRLQDCDLVQTIPGAAADWDVVHNRTVHILKPDSMDDDHSTGQGRKNPTTSQVFPSYDRKKEAYPLPPKMGCFRPTSINIGQIGGSLGAVGIDHFLPRFISQSCVVYVCKFCGCHHTSIFFHFFRSVHQKNPMCGGFWILWWSNMVK